jgi:peptidoglycan/LPS O-acetylase OafA/YrhL
MPDPVAGYPPARSRAPTKIRLAGIEAGRGIAACIVLLYHAARHLDKIHPSPLLAQGFRFGHAGVDFFFVMSGFIILHVHAADIGCPDRLAHYAGRRFSRVFPTYWVALALTLALAIAGQRHELPSADYVAASALLVPSHTAPLLGIAWTLQYEIVFYAVFAVLIVHRTAGMLVFILWLAWIAIASVVAQPAVVPRSLYGAYNFEFFAGMAAAGLLATVRVGAPEGILCGGVAAFVAAAAAEDAGVLDGYADIGRLAYGLPSVMIVLGAAAADRDRRLRVGKLLRAFGRASYSIYLFQFVFIGLAWRAMVVSGLSGVLPTLADFFVLAGCGIAGGVVMSRCVEYPLMRWLRRKEVVLF